MQRVLIAILVLIAAACSTAGETPTVVAAGPDDCWSLSYSDFWRVNAEAHALARPDLQCPSDYPTRVANGSECSADTGTVHLFLALLRGDASGTAVGPSALVAIPFSPLATPLEQADCVRENGSIQTLDGDGRLVQLEASESYQAGLAGRPAVCVDVDDPYAEGLARFCWFTVDDYMVVVRAGDYRGWSNEIDRLFQDVAQTIQLGERRTELRRHQTSSG